ncbi:MAG: hypothetical protein J07HB67_02203 [halophilic archaeon J07HB67]|jgi:hypothetical protein|nr:MAG: hypothetical protein J07HB67_02203 [halophilic archaeon J07HB67]
MPEDSTRRQVLKGIGSAVAVGGFGSTAASGRDGGSLPITVDGRREHEYRPTADGYAHTERFVSEAMERKYGVRVLEYDRPTVPERHAPEEVRNNENPTVERFHDTATVGQFREFVRAEQQVLTQVTGYDGPLYHYAADVDNPDPSDLGEKKAPINVVWNKDLAGELGSAYSSEDVKLYMESTVGWNQADWLASGDRYVVYPTTFQPSGVVRSADADVRDRIFGFKQWHIRLYDLDSHLEEGDYPVIGQAHKDPFDHNKIQNKPWKFDSAREKVTSGLTNTGVSVELESVGNGGPFDTADGSVARYTN